jgi:5'-nucleotidase
MGRETKILLGLLATLAGVFMGVLSMKLLVPRPPEGAGPDVHADVAVTEPHDLVDPPALDAVDAVDPSVTSTVVIAPPPEEFAPPPQRRFAPTAIHAVEAAPTPTQDPFVTTASLEQPAEPPAAALAAEPQASPASYVARPGDSWWSLAERAYGDGRLYRALFAWNRAIDPRVSLVPGTSIEVPPPARLQAAWPALLPSTN